jgi:protein SCO1/2
MGSRSGMAVGVAAAIAAGLGAALWLREDPLVLGAGTVLEEPNPVAPFQLVDHDGNPLDQHALAGRWHLVFAGFTHCPDICPTTLTMLAALRARLAGAGPQILFVSVDPERDTPGRLAVYLRHFDPEIIGATGSVEAIAAFTRELGLAQVKIPGAGADYTIDHSAALVLIDPQVRVAGYFQAPHDVEALAADLAALPNDG